MACIIHKRRSAAVAMLTLFAIGTICAIWRVRDSANAPENLIFQGRASWPQLFLPLPPITDSLDETMRLLFPSLRLFWPKHHRNLLVLTDAESPSAESFMALVERAVEPFVNQIQLATNLAYFPQTGHNRQQWLMFWADNFTSSEFVAFVDSDTVFTSRIFYEDLFVDEKPRVIGVYGQPMIPWWAEVPKVTFMATGIQERFKAMSYFPVVIRLSHLALIREHIRLHMNEDTFDNAFQRIIANKAWSQFNIMLNVLYERCHDQYYWHINERNPDWTGPVPEGQVVSKQAMRLEEFQRSRPKQAFHWTYENIDKSPGQYDEVLRFGLCYSLKAADRGSVCDQIDVDGQLNPYEWMFEGDNYSNRPGVFKAHRERRRLIEQADRFDWDQEIVDQILRPNITSDPEPDR